MQDLTVKPEHIEEATALCVDLLRILWGQELGPVDRLSVCRAKGMGCKPNGRFELQLWTPQVGSPHSLVQAPPLQQCAS